LILELRITFTQLNQLYIPLIKGHLLADIVVSAPVHSITLEILEHRLHQLSHDTLDLVWPKNRNGSTNGRLSPGGVALLVIFCYPPPF